jgi:L-ascorbate metabolism protein UlaG (beta-lactamase superfamily)
MGAPSAAKAVELCRPRIAVPIHYGTFPLLEPCADSFARLAGAHAEVRVLKPGEELSID